MRSTIACRGRRAESPSANRVRRTPHAAPTAIDVFHQRREARAILVSECEMDFQEAVDGLQAAAVQYGLIADLGQDKVQRIISEAFAKVPRPGKLEDAIAELADGLNDWLFDETSRPHGEVAQSTLDAAAYLVLQNDPERLRAWLEKHSINECTAIWRHLEQRATRC